MATIIKFLYSSYLANIIGGGVFATWLVIDFNDVKAIVVGCMSMIWLAGRGLISLYRLWIKAEREKWELQRDKNESAYTQTKNSTSTRQKPKNQ